MVSFSPRIALLTFASAVVLAAPALAQDAAPPVVPEVVAPSGIEAPLSEDGEVPGAPDDMDADDLDADDAGLAEAAVTPAIPVEWSPSPVDAEGRSAYGLYLAGRVAASRGEGMTGAAYLAAVEALAPEQPKVREQAFTAALLAGDLDDAARIAPSGEGIPPVIGEAGRLVAAVQTYATGDARGALAALRSNPIGSPHTRAAVFVQPWIAASAGDWEAALAPTGTGADLTNQIVRFNRAKLLEVRNRPDEAEAEFRVLTAGLGGQPLFRRAYGLFLERRGRRDEALALYDQALAADPGDGVIRLARERVVARGRPPQVETLRQGAAAALTAAAAIASNEGANEFAAVYVRLALNVDPSDELRLLLGSTLAKAELEAAAREAFAGVGQGDPEAYGAARAQIAASLGRQDRDEEALAEFRAAAAAAPANPRIAYFLASQLIQLDRHAEALTLLESPLLNAPSQGAEVRFMRGAAYESLGRIPEAEAQLWAALQAQPNEPAFLNYLGYLWVDSGARVAEGAEMIARAHAADPADGNIQDSLGWAQYRQGQYETAVATLEEAVAKEPANAEINDHLGDAYWRVGRRREAGFQWARVLTLAPNAEQRAGVETKLANGLGAPETPASAPQP